MYKKINQTVYDFTILLYIRDMISRLFSRFITVITLDLRVDDLKPKVCISYEVFN